jgi:hypothetical protein
MQKVLKIALLIAHIGYHKNREFYADCQNVTCLSRKMLPKKGQIKKCYHRQKLVKSRFLILTFLKTIF